MTDLTSEQIHLLQCKLSITDPISIFSELNLKKYFKLFFFFTPFQA